MKPAPPKTAPLQAERKRRRRKEARPAEIIEAGMKEFADKGFAATRLDDVALRAGISKATIYLYYPSKEALFEAALRDRLINTMDAMAEVTLTFEGSTEALLRTFLAAAYDRLIDGEASVLLKVLIAEGHRFPALVTLYRETAVARGMQVLGAILRRGAARGDLRLPPEAIDPRLILAPAVAAAIWTMVFAESAPIDREAFMAAHLDILLRGILTRP